MKILYLMLAAFVISLTCTAIFSGEMDFVFSGCVGMSAMLLLTGFGHFAYTKGMMLMMPPSIPYKKAIVYITGVIELAAAVGLLIVSIREVTAWFLIAFLIAIFPSNVYAAIKRVRLVKADHLGPGIEYLWIRVPLQIVFIVWTWYFGIYLFKL